MNLLLQRTDTARQWPGTSAAIDVPETMIISFAFDETELFSLHYSTVVDFSWMRPCLDFDISFLFTSFSFHFHGVSNLDFFVNFAFGKN
jgi:hypothetical protein